MQLRVVRSALMVLAVLATGIVAARAGEVRVFAAASLAQAMEEVGAAFDRGQQSGMKLVFAGSSTLARQIEAGAEADIIVSADEAWMAYMAKRNLVMEASRRELLGNRLVLVAASDLTEAPGLDQLSSWLAQHRDARLAMGDPAHVPVGRYGQAALTALGQWTEVRQRLAATADTRAALALVERGEAALGVVYATDAAASRRVRITARFPASSHPPITYPIAIVRGRDGAAVREAYAFLCREAAAAIFAKHGFDRR
jgi:molybdate transport system substrate-binding protein